MMMPLRLRNLVDFSQISQAISCIPGEANYAQNMPLENDDDFSPRYGKQSHAYSMTNPQSDSLMMMMMMISVYLPGMASSLMHIT